MERLRGVVIVSMVFLSAFLVGNVGCQKDTLRFTVTEKEESLTGANKSGVVGLPADGTRTPCTSELLCSNVGGDKNVYGGYGSELTSVSYNRLLAGAMNREHGTGVENAGNSNEVTKKEELTTQVNKSGVGLRPDRTKTSCTYRFFCFLKGDQNRYGPHGSEQTSTGYNKPMAGTFTQDIGTENMNAGTSNAALIDDPKLRDWLSADQFVRKFGLAISKCTSKFVCPRMSGTGNTYSMGPFGPGASSHHPMQAVAKGGSLQPKTDESSGKLPAVENAPFPGAKYGQQPFRPWYANRPKYGQTTIPQQRQIDQMTEANKWDLLGKKKHVTTPPQRSSDLIKGIILHGVSTIYQNSMKITPPSRNDHHRKPITVKWQTVSPIKANSHSTTRSITTIGVVTDSPHAGGAMVVPVIVLSVLFVASMTVGVVFFFLWWNLKLRLRRQQNMLCAAQNIPKHKTPESQPPLLHVSLSHDPECSIADYTSGYDIVDESKLNPVF
ncbi:hypothetical protein ScPMuIL_002974 [Solemya velum]